MDQQSEQVRLLQNHLDSEGRVEVWPSKRKLKQVVLEYLARHFDMDRQYSEKEINAQLNQLHTFADPALLRRELFQCGFLGRTRNGATYWRIVPSATPTSLPTEESNP